MERCALCQSETTLRRSHIIPAWAYAGIQRYDDQNRAPVVVSNGIAIATSKQICEDMLCDSCEQRFSRRETLAQKLALDDHGKSPLLNLPSAQTIVSSATVQVLTAVSEIYAALSYFAISVVWRASIAVDNADKRCSLGRKYEDAVRPYLLDLQPMPSAFVVHLEVMKIDPSSTYHRVATLPVSIRRDGFHYAYFFINGLHFIVYTGNRIHADVRATALSEGEHQCRVRSPDTMLHFEFAKRAIYRSKAKGALKKSGIWNPES